VTRGLKRYHVQLDFGRIDDEERHMMAVGIAEVAPQSQLYLDNPRIQVGVAAVADKAATLKACNLTVGEAKARLRAYLTDEAQARSEVDNELRSLAALTEGAARSPGDIVQMTFVARDQTRSFAPPPAPAGVNVMIPVRGRGRVTVSAQSGDGKRHLYEANVCPYGSDVWTRLVGSGKERLLEGPSGAQIWVRFATVRGQAQSDWCTPVLVTIP
jgi:hypothetical protein